MRADNLEELFQKAREAMERGGPEKARPFYQQALALKPDSPDVHYGLAAVCFQMNDLPGAAHHFKEVTRLDPLRASAYVSLGGVYNLLDQAGEAVVALRRGIQLDPERAEGYYNLALVHRRMGQTNLALQAYQDTLRVNPRMADAHYNLANLYLEEGEFERAISHYRLALQLRPSWDRATAGLEQAQEALAEQEQPADEAPSEGGERPPGTSRRASFLKHLQRATAESEKSGQQFLRVLEGEVEPVIQELTTLLLYPDTPPVDLDACARRFETAVQNMRGAHRDLQASIRKLRALGERLQRR